MAAVHTALRAAAKAKAGSGEPAALRAAATSHASALAAILDKLTSGKMEEAMAAQMTLTLVGPPTREIAVRS